MRVLGFIVGLLLFALRDAVIAATISGVLCLTQWIGSLMSMCKAPTWHIFLWGWLGVFVVLYTAHLIHAKIEYTRKRKDPVYKQMNEESGIDYRTYKEFTKEINKIKNKKGE